MEPRLKRIFNSRFSILDFFESEDCGIPSSAGSCRKAPLAFENRKSKIENIGTALVIVLAGLVILSVIAVAFLSTVTTEVALSRNYASKAEATLLAESAVNRVIAQIQTATEDPNRVWSSQPGAITTFTQNGSIHRAYKLYSSDNLVTDDYDELLADVPNDWASQEAVYVDLNQPVANGDRQHFPILDAAALGEVVGFSAVNDDVSMPVQWLYMLEDGSLGPASNGSETNPIIGRVAFWTDDETCKININTAAGDEWEHEREMDDVPGSYWSIPSTSSDFDRSLSRIQPVQGEFQRYPGHPATTYLSAVFPDLTREQITEIAPRGVMETNGARTTRGGTIQGTGRMTIPQDRLYASVEEMLFDTNRQERTFLSPQRLDLGRFFLTAHSRAPEINLFNKPRVSIWPVDTSPSRRTTFDRLSAFATTVGDSVFHFTRNGGGASYRSPTMDFENNPRNEELYHYLRNLTSSPVPAFGGQTFSGKYTNLGRDQILTQIFDYIRCTNLADTSEEGINFTPLYSPPPGVSSEGFPQDHAGQVVPIEITTSAGETKGFGRISGVSEAALVFTLKNSFEAPVEEGGTETGLFLEMGGVALFEVFNPMEGFAAYKDTYDIRVTGLNSFRYGYFLAQAGPAPLPAGLADLVANESEPETFTPDDPFHDFVLLSMMFPETGTNLVRRGSSQDYAVHAKPSGGIGGIAHLLFHPEATPQAGSPKKVFSQVTGVDSYPFYTQVDMVLPPVVRDQAEPGEPPEIIIEDREYFWFSGGTITVELIVDDHVVHNYRMSFPAAWLPVPDDSFVNMELNPTLQELRDFENRLEMRLVRGSAQPPPGLDRAPRHVDYLLPRGNTIRRGDTIISLVPESYPYFGDVRLMMGKTSQVTDAFIPTPRYMQATTNPGAGNALNQDRKKSHDLKRAGGSYLPAGNDGTGRLVPGCNYHLFGSLPNVSTNLAGGVTRSDGGAADWDTGQGNYADGPMLNKADEGNALSLLGGSELYPYYHTSWQEHENTGPTFFSPNRQVPSPVVFGSLPTGIVSNDPWQTLLFNPKPEEPENQLHPGKASPHDHLLLDLFSMPVVEPYPLTEPFSTAGKVNLNHMIMPFTGIRRTTALQAVLRSTRIPAIPQGHGEIYKRNPGSNNYRYLIDLERTMDAFDSHLNGIQLPLFRSASEICEIPLIPDVTTPGTPVDSFTDIAAFWQQNQLTGDNLRERPYAEIYGRLTTKSNTYTVHVRAQSIQKAPGTPPDEFVPGRDQITGEYRGSHTIERYLDPNIETYNESEQLGPYHFRVVNVRTFDP